MFILTMCSSILKVHLVLDWEYKHQGLIPAQLAICNNQVLSSSNSVSRHLHQLLQKIPVYCFLNAKYYNLSLLYLFLFFEGNVFFQVVDLLN